MFHLTCDSKCGCDKNKHPGFTFSDQLDLCCLLRNGPDRQYTCPTRQECKLMKSVAILCTTIVGRSAQVLKWQISAPPTRTAPDTMAIHDVTFPPGPSLTRSGGARRYGSCIPIASPNMEPMPPPRSTAPKINALRQPGLNHG